MALPMSKRLFIGLSLPYKVCHSLRTLVKDAGLASESVKMVLAVNMHLTVKFLGSVNVAEIPQLLKALQSLDVPRFRMRISSLGFFGPAAAPRVLWAGVEAGPDTLGKLRKAVDAAVFASGIELKHLRKSTHAVTSDAVDEDDHQPDRYNPHVTLARIVYERSHRRHPSTSAEDPQQPQEGSAAGGTAVLAAPAVSGVPAAAPAADAEASKNTTQRDETEAPLRRFHNLKRIYNFIEANRDQESEWFDVTELCLFASERSPNKGARQSTHGAPTSVGDEPSDAPGCPLTTCDTIGGTTKYDILTRVLLYPDTQA